MTNASDLLIAKQGWLAAYPSSLQDSLRAHLQWVRYRTGQPLLQADRLPHQVMIIAEGAVRLVAEDPATGPFSLARLGVGDALGWCGLVRGQPTETAIAMEPSLVAAIPARQFLSLLASESALRQACLEPDRTELAELLLAWLTHQPQHYEDLPGLLAEMWRPGAVRVLTGEDLQQATSLDPGWLWLPSAPLEAGDSIGIAIERWLPASSEHSGVSLPLGPRLLGLSRSALQEALQLRAVMPQGKADVNGGGHALKELWEQAREADELPDPIDPRDLGLPNSSLRLPPLTERGEGPLESAMVCLNRLAGRYHFPFPRDTVQQVLLDCQTRLGGISLLQLGQLLESLGLEVRPLRSPANRLHRLEPPALLQLENRFLLIEAAGPRGLIAVDPTSGLMQFELKDLARLWPDGLELMLVRPAESAADDEQVTRFDLAWFWSVMQPYRLQLGLLLITGFVGKLLALVFPLAVLQIIDVVVGSRNLSLLLPIGVVMGVAIVVMGLLGLLKEYLLSDLSDRIDTRLGSQIVGHLFRLPLKFFDRRTVGDLASRLFDLQRVRTFLTNTAISSSLDLLFIPLVAVVLFCLQPLLAAVVMVQIPILILSTRLSRNSLKVLLTRRNRAWGKAQGFLVEVLTAIRTVKSQNFASQARWQWLERYRRYTGEDFRLTKMRVSVSEFNKAIANFNKVALFMVGGWLVVSGQGSVGSLFAVYILSNGIVQPLLNISSIADQYRDAKAAMDALADVLGQQPEESIGTANMLPLPAIQGRVDFERVAFSYDLDGRRQLDDFSLTIAPGTFVGLVGSSGSGKSTVVQLLDGLYRANEGRLFVDGTDISKVQIGSLRRQVGFVPQESILFDGTVLENLRLNLPDAPYEAVVEAAKIACAHEFIMALPNGYNTRVGERGGALSGGQKQRIAIARMVLQNPNMVILDEATSALDLTTEFLLLERLKQRFSGRTMIVVTHRVTTLRDADRILLMDEGVILEEGNWDELLNLGGSFSTLAEQQRAINA